MDVGNVGKQKNDTLYQRRNRNRPEEVINFTLGVGGACVDRVNGGKIEIIKICAIIESDYHKLRNKRKEV